MTHIDETGHATPPVLLSRFTDKNLAANIPEFRNCEIDETMKITQQFIDDESYLMSGYLNANADEFDLAIKNFRKAIDLNPNNMDARSALSLALDRSGYTEEAIEELKRALAIDPDNYLTLNNYAYYLSVDGIELDKAERMSGRVVERFPDNATYLDTHAWVLFKKGEYTLAKFYMDSAIKNSQDESDTLLEHYGDILYKVGKVDKALEYWIKAKEIGSESETLDRKIAEKKYIEE